ncbi:Ras association domain-containing protein 8 [Echinococcus granulosus]|uniref:Ras association domain-containing protein 8 n=1 Tax=Echinococcus granulosus TaxID=6210 RepID=W6UCW3_ECHGR|nr:Ras association domain-containing protein 8 [Echinococcus granulosus]EUB59140.1 Ras association domain-containing protein 8 [Echinococcus granulosus]
MELRVFVNGKPRDVCGVDENTTAEDVVNVLCESLRLVGYYCLVAFWRKNEIVFSPSESPLNVITSCVDEIHSGAELANIQSSFSLFFVEPISTDPKIRRARDPPSLRRIITDEHYLIHRNTHLFRTQQQLTISCRIPALEDRKTKAKVAAAFAGRTQELDVGYAEELQQLSIVDWSRRLEEARQHQVSLQNERSRLQLDLQRLDNELRQARSKVQSLESEMANELTNLLNAVEGALEERRKIVAGLLVAFEAPQLPASSGTNHVCDEVMI